MTNKNILITGGAGFIGSRLALQLLARGHKVRVLDSLAPQIHGTDPDVSHLYQTIRGKVDFIRGSVTSREDLMRALPGIDTVVHLAAETGTGQSMYAIQHYTDVNVGVRLCCLTSSPTSSCPSPRSSSRLRAPSMAKASTCARCMVLCTHRRGLPAT